MDKKRIKTGKDGRLAEIGLGLGCSYPSFIPFYPRYALLSLLAILYGTGCEMLVKPASDRAFAINWKAI